MDAEEEELDEDSALSKKREKYQEVQQEEEEEDAELSKKREKYQQDQLALAGADADSPLALNMNVNVNLLALREDSAQLHTTIDVVLICALAVLALCIGTRCM